MTSFLLELDTQAPIIEWETAPNPVESGAFSLGYSIDEPGIVSASIQDSNNDVYPLSFDGSNIYGFIPPEVASGAGFIVARVKDEVDNEAFRTLAVNFLAAPAPEIVDDLSGGGRFIGIGGPAFETEEFIFEAETVALRPEEFTFSSAVISRREDEFSFSASALAAKDELHAFDAIRAPAYHFAQVLKDEDEILVLL
jgi:hypothetical protein